jgi:hypothetical protein
MGESEATARSRAKSKKTLLRVSLALLILGTAIMYGEYFTR